MDIPTAFLPLLAPRLGGQSTRTEPRWRVTALGGGHGLSASLSALRRLDTDLTAVVTVADDGGSSGTIREEFDVIPPGDLRMALAALCDDTDWGRTWRDVMQHRFASKPGSRATLDNHAVGNLLIVALWEMLQDPVDGLRWAGALLGARGTVLPMSESPLRIQGHVLSEGPGGLSQRFVDGQVALATAAKDGTVTEVSLVPAEAAACPEAVTAIATSDWNVLGPGSWYTSVLPHLLLPGLREALVASPARTLVTMNLDTDTTETLGLDAAGHLDLIGRYAPGLRVDAVLADPRSVEDVAGFEAAARRLGATVFFDRVGAGSGEPVHDSLRLAAAYRDILESFDRPARTEGN